MNTKINILDYSFNIKNVLGPGNRFVLWTQGCPFNCKDCTTPEGIPIVENKLLSINNIVEKILSQKELDGITLSGGEPFLQASKLVLILKKVIELKPSINIITYTGFKYSKLDWKEAKELLKHIDLLIDGQFVNKLNDNLGIRGSTNQNFIYLSNKLIPYKRKIEDSERKYEYIEKDNVFSTIGIPKN